LLTKDQVEKAQSSLWAAVNNAFKTLY